MEHKIADGPYKFRTLITTGTNWSPSRHAAAFNNTQRSTARPKKWRRTLYHSLLFATNEKTFGLDRLNRVLYLTLSFTASAGNYDRAHILDRGNNRVYCCVPLLLQYCMKLLFYKYITNRLPHLHVCTVHQQYQNTFILFQLMHTIIKS